MYEQLAVAQVQPCSQVDCRELADAVVQLLRVNRQGDGVQIDDTEDVVVLRLRLCPVAQRAQVVAQVQVARRLNAGKDPFFHGSRSGHGWFRFDIVVHVDGHFGIPPSHNGIKDNKKRRSSLARDERRKAFVVPP